MNTRIILILSNVLSWILLLGLITFGTGTIVGLVLTIIKTGNTQDQITFAIATAACFVLSVIFLGFLYLMIKHDEKKRRENLNRLIHAKLNPNNDPNWARAINQHIKI